MKRRWSILLMLPAMLVGSACTAPPDQSIIVTEARAPGDTCDFSDPTKYVEAGAIDLAAFGRASYYYQVFGWENDLQNVGVTVNGQVLTTGTTNTFIASSIRNSYQVINGPGTAVATPPASLVNISATIPPGATPLTASVGVQLLTQAAAQSICGAPTATDNCPGLPVGPLGQPSPSVTLLVTFQLVGATVGGSGAQTNPITYPLTLINYGHVNPVNGTCTGGYVPQTTSCNVPGRDLQYCVPP